jgi:CPA2 family monovalent cation:H+ antiporter-2
MHGILWSVSILCLVILLLVFLLKKLHQPYLLAYILAGVLLGPYSTAVFTNPETIGALGELGVLLLMFFLGMEIDIPDKRSLLLNPLLAQGFKMLLSFLCALVFGKWMHWPMESILLLTVLLTFNSTVAVSEFLRKNRELHTANGKMVLNILLLQDILLAPILSLFQLMGSGKPDIFRLLAALAGSVLIFFLLRAVRNRHLFQLPFVKEIGEDHDLQVFAGACLCLGFALIASLAGLTGAIGSFAAGIFIGRAQAFHWLEKVLQPFKVFFTALFFVSVGIMIDLAYIKQHYILILVITTLVMVINSLLSAIVFRLLRYPWQNSIYAGALLSQTGEFGLLACSLAYQMGIIPLEFFKAGLAITALSLFICNLWMSVIRKYIYVKSNQCRPLNT